ncbi:PREDICTED: ultraviolet-B receptor UVR8 isoform X2 [Nelumbo nucifera]|uniref:Ultraviolet-B receptor UVR8 isoform X2 n=1 Tax=Nelumbo nucifera TaxID=4432 RepID=A0A1U8B9N2_NELNU|nr:PREDICTED: ultraviolet-B receptor UVR8 isoform X2 [Nelumbo nucifera]
MWRRCLRVCRSTSMNGLGLGFWRRWMSTEPKKRFAALWGNGDYGRLGLGKLDSQWRPAVCPGFENESLRAIACGGAHTLFLTESGCVFATGLNDFGQLGISIEKRYTQEPLEVTGFNKEIVYISAGYHHSSAITVDGELYMWGNNSSGQLGLGRTKIVSSPSIIECLGGMRIKMIALGSEHSIAVTDDGEALTWGEGGSGRLGHGHQSSILGFLRSPSEYTPRLIKELEGIKVKNVAAGLLHSACIDENGSVFIFGERAADKLGFVNKNKTTLPSIISKIPSSEEIACGGYHTCVITNGGELYTWGSNENGCLGIGCTEVIHSPERVEGPFMKLPVCKVSCGWKHTAVISGDNIFTWGWGGSHGTFSEDGHSSGGQLGHGSDIDHFEPTMVNFGENVKALQVSCGFNHTGAILEYT